MSEQSIKDDVSVDLCKEAFADRVTQIMTYDDDSMAGVRSEVKNIGEIIGNIQLTPNVAEKTPTSPVAGSSNQQIKYPTKLQMRKINFNEYKQYFENTDLT